MPNAKELAILNLLSNLNPTAIPRIVENSANPFIEELTTCPLRARIATEAIMEVKVAGIRPKRRRDKTMGIPVKSNLRNGSHGKAIFKPEYFIV